MKYFDNEYYHLYNRGAHKGAIFFSEENFRYLLSLITSNAQRFGVTCVAYCLMPNHFHFIVRQENGGSVSKCVQTTFNAYTQAVNKQNKLSGILFQGKTRARHIDSDTYIMQVVRYVHLNPIEAGLVKSPEDWKFSDYQEWITEEPSEGFLNLGRDNLRKVFFTSGSDYRQFVEEYQREKDQQKIDKYLFLE